MGGEILTGVRKAFGSKGDDTTLTRFVKTEKERKSRKQRRQPRFPGIGELPFITEGRTKFPRTVKPVAAVTHLLVSGHNNVKIGRDVRKAKFRGYWIYTLSLEERKTCPATCRHWQTCYGNNMPFAKRIDHSDILLLPQLRDEIADLCATRKGILIRLHALGDFFSEDYVDFWWQELAYHQNLAVYGYTARRPETDDIGARIRQMNRRFDERCMIRFSDGGFDTMSTVSIGDETGKPSNAFICPEQTGKTACCATCGACWSTTKNVAFMEH